MQNNIVDPYDFEKKRYDADMAALRAALPKHPTKEQKRAYRKQQWALRKRLWMTRLPLKIH